MGTMWPRSGSYEFDNNGNRAPGAKAYFYEGVTSTPLAVFQDAAGDTPYTVTVAADGNGRWPAVFIPFGTYSLTIKTSGGTTLFQVSGVPNPAPTDPDVGVDPDSDSIFHTGDYLFVGANAARDGFVRCNGDTIGNAVSSATERANADCEDLFGYIWNNYANGQAAVSGGRGGTAAADFAAGKRIALPDHRNALMIGFGDNGAVDAGLVASAPVVSGSGILAGSIIGANTHAILEAQLPAHAHGVGTYAGAANGAHTHSGTTGDQSQVHTHSGTTETQSAGHTHTVGPGQPSTTNGAFNGAGGSGWGGVTGTNATGVESASHTHTVTTGSESANHHHTFSTTSDPGTHTHTMSGSSGSIGSSTAHNILSRSIPVTVLMKL